MQASAYSQRYRQKDRWKALRARGIREVEPEQSFYWPSMLANA